VAAVKGISVSPPVADFTAASYGLTAARVSAIKNAGFNTLRMFVDMSEIISTPSTLTSKWVPWIQKGIDTGLRVIVCVSGSPSWDKSTGTNNWKTATASIASALTSNWTPDKIAFDIVNEPFGYTGSEWETYFAPLFWNAARIAAPDLTLIVQGGGGWFGNFPNFNAGAFDDNTMFSFHPYEVGEFTHRFNYDDMPRLTFPISDYAGGKTQMIADITAAVNANSGLTGAQKTTRISDYSTLANYLFSGVGYGKEWLNQSWATIDTWAAQNRIDPRRIIAGEFGASGDFNFNGKPGVSLQSRVNFYRATRELLEARGYGGYVAHQAMGDFNIFQQTAVGTHGDTLIPEIVTALFG
jgi:hypothetical protein